MKYIFPYIYIPDDIVDKYILPNVDNKIKMLLCKKYYYSFHNIYYNFSYKYLHFLIKNNIVICCNLLTDYSNFDILKKEKILYHKKIFFSVYDYCIYLSKKYNNTTYLNYFNRLYTSNRELDSRFSNLRIKGYKNFINKNILWTK